MPIKDTFMNNKLKSSALSFFAEWPWNNPLAITLTCRKGVESHGGQLTLATLDRVQTNLRHVMNRVNGNKHIFGNKGKRKKKRLQVVAIAEQDRSGRYHLHLQVDIPVGLSSELLMETLEREWRESDWGYNEIDVQPARDVGWLDYMLKTYSKAEYDLSIDWNNCQQAIT